MKSKHFLFLEEDLPNTQISVLPVRVLAQIGDTVFTLFEQERLVLSAESAKTMHSQAVSRVQAQNQAQLLENLKEYLSDSELELVRRSRNVKTRSRNPAGQSAYRRSTAFEALIGYLYLTDQTRLKEMLKLTLKF